MIKKHFKPSRAIQKPRKYSGDVGFVTIINSTKNGRRVEFRKEIVEKIGVTNTIAVSYDGDTVAFYKPSMDSDTIIFNVSESNGRAVVYSYQLVEELAEFFNLDFTTRVCHTISDGGFDVFEEENQPVMFIKRAGAKDTSNVVINDASESADIEREVEVNE